VNKVVDFESAMLSYVRSNYADLLKQINDTGDYNDEIAAKMKEALDKFKSSSTW
jgi:F-type H+-transporting ATPase subunit alpha